MRRKGEEAGTGAKGGLCRAEGAEVPVFSWGGVFFIRHCRSAHISRTSCRIY
ncbi:hypothetical protein BACUNI_02586 [Bacteroides uniformis ATCC 8492]|uniref:Uncharacterized protein n=1 Tax=Bacteroides uniformis (strain ATCC 8492 / DSM 6597 / CCUG 4942 / CIP 103695 / JCM 5828 / KCTC 5204 / NCTC 13054 / VPI 0061) TaxID=411479 RepID=A0ABC9NBA2_BACUC|nr:hypothetical protein BACUNI_02586 [Bacteroides uniformis ATCC 8492]